MDLSGVLQSTPAPEASALVATPFARTSDRPTVHGLPPSTTTLANASVLALVDTIKTAEAMEAVLRSGKEPRRGAARSLSLS